MDPERFDLFTLGETMIRLTPKGFARLEEMHELEVRIGGSESNVAVALARLGLRASWASRLPRNPLGLLVARRLRSFGVDLSAVRWVDDARMGLYFIEPAPPPRRSQVLYDRAHSAASGMQPDDFDWSILDRARHLHLTGITPALGDGPAATVARAIREARARNRTISFDVNYRARLWSVDAARVRLAPLVADVDLLICTREDARSLFDASGSAEETAEALGERTRAGLVAVTLGGEGAILWDRSRFHRAAPFPVQVVDRIGAGDAFDAGLIRGFLHGDPVSGLRYGMAMAALKHTLPGDEFVASAEEVEALLQAGDRDVAR